MAKPLKLVGHCTKCNQIVMHTRPGSKANWKEYKIIRFCKHKDCRNEPGENGRKGHFLVKLKIHKGKS